MNKPPMFIFLLDCIGLGHLCYRLACLRLLGLQGPPESPGDSPSPASIDRLVDHFTEFRPAELLEYALTAWFIQLMLTKAIDIQLLPATGISFLEGPGAQTPGGSAERKVILGLWTFRMLRRLQCNAHALTEIRFVSPAQRLDRASARRGSAGRSKKCRSRTSGSACVAKPLGPILPSPIRRLGEVRVASGLFPCAALLNHSCRPSVSNGFQVSPLPHGAF
ncbi:unnamed protein product [Protopolystoma xenopodis]|uniref:SET domain-containing protein n=1 Tax=Protopolystoma xenopodis TaxID=117903 RepID=A0A448XJE5_9PLAT|nr:unnamed protein product [Protopolystoma xenopodis]